MPANLPRVVIVGGGFGGLYAARTLAGAPVSVTLIDRRNYHLFRPMLYQVATGLLSADEISGPLRSILSRQRNVEVLMDEVVGVDALSRHVHLPAHDLPYDFLILATGIQYNYFGHDEWQQIAPGLESLDDADEIRGKVLLAFERAEELAALGHAAPELIQQLLTFVLVGGGTVGVEMASTPHCDAISAISIPPRRQSCYMRQALACYPRIPRRFPPRQSVTWRRSVSKSAPVLEST